MWIDLFTGNEELKRSMHRSLESDSLSHGIMLCADRGLGAGYFACLLARDITGRKDREAVIAGRDPAVTVVQGEGISGNIKVDSVREVIGMTRYSSVESERRAVVIKGCENFNPYSANALLKSLEEPVSDVTYILTTRMPGRVLPTIRSRCSVYNLAPPSKKQAEEYFSSRDLRRIFDGEKYGRLLSVYGPNIGKIRNRLRDENRWRIFLRAGQAVSALRKKNRYAFSKTCFTCLGDRASALSLLDDLEDICLSDFGRDKVGLMSLLREAGRRIKQNANLNLVFENLSAKACR